MKATPLHRLQLYNKLVIGILLLCNNSLIAFAASSSMTMNTSSTSTSSRTRDPVKAKKNRIHRPISNNDCINNNNNDNNNINNNNNNNISICEQTKISNINLNVRAILIPRTVSIPHIIRFISAFLFTSSLLESFRTTGIPYANAVHALLSQHNIPSSTSATTTFPSPIQQYIARKLSQSSSTIILPPKFLPLPLPLFGIFTSLFLYFGLVILFPKWFTSFHVWLYYQYVPISNIHSYSHSDSHSDFNYKWFQHLQTIRSILIHNKQNCENPTQESHTIPHELHEHEHDSYHQSQFILNPNHLQYDQQDLTHGKKRTGLFLLINTSTTNTDSSHTTNTADTHFHHLQYNQNQNQNQIDIIQPLYSTTSTGHISHSSNMTDTHTHSHLDHQQLLQHPSPFYIELNQQRIYVNIDIHLHDDNPLTLPIKEHISIQCYDGGPTFYKTHSISQLLSSSSSSSSSSFSPIGLTSIPKLKYAQTRYNPYNSIQIPIPTISQTFKNRVSSPLVVLQLLGKLLTLLEDDNIFMTLFNIITTFVHHYINSKKSIVAATELYREIQDNVVHDVDDGVVWALRPVQSKHQSSLSSSKNKTITRTNKKNKNKQVERYFGWIQMSSSQLLPGDIFILDFDDAINDCSQKKSHSHSQREIIHQHRRGYIMPVDALLLQGSCLALEAVITGESVPQAKVPIEVDSYSDDEQQHHLRHNLQTNNESHLCMEGTHRKSVLFAGSTVMNPEIPSYEGQSEGGQDHFFIGGIACPPLPNQFNRKNGSSIQPIVCLALRTGSYSSKGDIVRALSKNNICHAGSISTPQTEKDSLRLITGLSVAALFACISLFTPNFQFSHDRELDKSSTRRKVSSFRRIVQCTRICVASIPSDLPLALSSILQTCASHLRMDTDVTCSEPGSLLTASNIDMIVFDKTGTLTSDTQSMTSVVPPIKYSNQDNDDRDTLKTQFKRNNRKKQNMHPMLHVVLAGCHSLVSLGNGNDNTSSSNTVIGDPLDLASLRYSKWSFDGKNLSATAPIEKKVGDGIMPKQIWQIKTFPFDPNLSRSSAILLVQNSDGHYNLVFVSKGSPDTMRANFENDSTDDSFSKWYAKTLEGLGMGGIRVVAMGVRDLTKTSICDELFPGGWIKYKNTSTDVEKMVQMARHTAQTKIFRSDVEVGALDFVGFSCFDAAIRPSTQRVLKDIIASRRNVCMLTGDSTLTAMSVAQKVGLYDPSIRKFALIEKSRDNDILRVTIFRGRLKKGGKTQVKEYPISIKMLQKIFKQNEEGRCAIVTTGLTIDFILSHINADRYASNNHEIFSHIIMNLPKISVISKASPLTKQRVVFALKKHCHQKVMMCGDGVNDIAAMKSADVSVALLNGYGSESNDNNLDIDMENIRRVEKINKKRLGRRRDHSVERKCDSNTIQQARIKQKLDEALLLAQKNDQDGFNYAKSLTKSYVSIIKEEMSRSKALRMGGAGAAKILAEEDSLKRTLLKKATTNSDINSEEGDSSVAEDATIRPGEASLAAAFTLLRPCVDGVDAILRQGIATAAFSLSSIRTISLNSLMSCFNLATLYRDGFRYGKYMWNVELTFMMAIDKALYETSCVSRPKLSKLRPQESVFHPSHIVSILLQSVIHLFCLSSGARFASRLEREFGKSQSTGLRIRLIGTGNGSSISGMISSLGNESKSNGGMIGGIFGRRPFKPNLITNTVFILSIFQNAVISFVNNIGYPYHYSILESRQLCFWLSLSVIFCYVLIMEPFPFINAMLELAPMPSKKSKGVLMILTLIDVFGALGVDRLCTYFLDKELWDAKQNKRKLDEHIMMGANRNLQEKNAVDMEEALLVEEWEENVKFLTLSCICLIIILSINSIVPLHE